jgi:hypothetical protein
VEIVWVFKDSKEKDGGVNDKMKSFIFCAFHRASLEKNKRRMNDLAGHKPYMICR